jgi:hypothetical protein
VCLIEQPLRIKAAVAQDIQFTAELYKGGAGDFVNCLVADPHRFANFRQALPLADSLDNQSFTRRENVHHLSNDRIGLPKPNLFTNVLAGIARASSGPGEFTLAGGTPVRRLIKTLRKQIR